MDAEKLNPLVDPQADDVMFAARYVEGLFTPFQISLGGLLGMIVVNPPSFSSTSLDIAASQTLQAATSFVVVKSQGTGSQLALISSFVNREQTIANRTGADLTVITIDTSTIEGQTSVVIPSATTTTFRFVSGENQWYAQ